MKISLASTSPRRRQILARLGIPFTVLPPRHKETIPSRTSSPQRLAVSSALAKARSVQAEVNEGLIIGVDTIVVLGTRILGKPESREDARRMLRSLSGRTHSVISGLAVIEMPDMKERTAFEATQVTFRRLKEVEIDRYVHTPEPYDKAGAYAVQGWAGRFINSIHGSYLNVVGLPLFRLLSLLHTLLGSERLPPA